MLVLSRRRNEQIVITTNLQIVRVHVLDTAGNKVRLGIDAPENVAVYRQEVWRRLDEFHMKKGGDTHV